MALPKPERKFSSSRDDNKKLNFIKLTEGRHLIRLLQPLSQVKLTYTHWVRGTSVECPGTDVCPICRYNQEILLSVDGDWDKAKEVKQFNPYQVRYYANVLDRTPVKVSPKSETGFENKRRPDNTWPLVCEETGEFLEGVEERPSNTVKILAGGVTLFNALESIDNATLDENENKIGIENYDIVLMISGTGRDRKTSPVPQERRNDVIDVDEHELYDLDRALIVFTPEEITDFLNGTSLSDIFKARRLSESEPEVDTERAEVSFVEEKKQADTIAKSINDLISNK